MAMYSLFSGRHELPENEGAICQAFDFVSKSVVKTELWDKALQDEDCKVIVTGLTPALTQFISEYKGRNACALTLLHYDNATNTYWEQYV